MPARPKRNPARRNAESRWHNLPPGGREAPALPGCSDPPPRTGAGSRKAAWLEYATAVGLEVDSSWSRADLIAAVDAGGVTDPWLPETREAWARWWASPMAAQWDQSDIPQLVAVARLFNEVAAGDLGKLAEFRLWAGQYGLTPRGRRDLRWLVQHGTGDTPDEAGSEVLRANAAARSRQRIRTDPRTLVPLRPVADA